MRLIDADTLIKNLSYLYTKNHIPVDMRAKEILTTIMEQPTAYNVDKVVEEIKTLKEEALGEYNMGEYNLDNNIGNRISQNYRKDMNEGRCFAYDEAIEIVKQGGVGTETETIRDKAVKWNNNSSKRVPYEFIDYVEGKRGINISDDACEWRLCDEEANVYDTSCRNPHILIEGTPQENNYEFCPYCGKKILCKE